jgi:hypothetical protein
MQDKPPEQKRRTALHVGKQGKSTFVFTQQPAPKQSTKSTGLNATIYHRAIPGLGEWC